MAILQGLELTSRPVFWHNPGDPPPWSKYVFSLLNVLALKSISGRMANVERSKEFSAMLDAQIQADIDELCPRPPKGPFPPGPHRFAFAVATELILFAATLPEGQLQKDINATAGELTGRASQFMA